MGVGMPQTAYPTLGLNNRALLKSARNLNYDVLLPKNNKTFFIFSLKF